MVNVANILKEVPKGTKLWSNNFGDVEFDRVFIGVEYPIRCIDAFQNYRYYTEYGYYDKTQKNGECTLWPSKNHRAWDDEAYKILGIEKKQEVPFGLKPFDKVLVRNLPDDYWRAEFFSFIFIYSGEKTSFHFACVGNQWKYCIPYNDETKHLLGTIQMPPEKYRQ